MPQLIDRYFTEIGYSSGESLALELAQRGFTELEKMKELLNEMDSKACFEWAITREAWVLLALRDDIGELLSPEQFDLYLNSFSQGFWEKHPGGFDSSEELASELKSRVDRIAKIRKLISIINRDVSWNILLDFILKYVCKEKFVSLRILENETQEEIRERAAKAGKADAVPKDIFALFHYSAVMKAYWEYAKKLLNAPPEEARVEHTSQGCLFTVFYLMSVGLLVMAALYGIIR